MKAKIEVVLSDERLITPSGLCMVGQIFGKSQLAKKAARMKTDKRSQPQIKNGDILLTEIGMLTLGKTNFDYVNEFHSDPEYYKLALGIAYGLPCESTLRMRLDTIGQTMVSMRTFPRSPFIRRVWCVSVSPSSQGSPALWMELLGAAPVPPS